MSCTKEPEYFTCYCSGPGMVYAEARGQLLRVCFPFCCGLNWGRQTCGALNHLLSLEFYFEGSKLRCDKNGSLPESKIMTVA